MKTLLTLLLVTTSSIVMANGYYELSETEMWRDSPTSNSFSDSRYRMNYSPAQRQAFTEQRNAEIAHRSQAELEKQTAHYNDMSQYYSAQRASQQYMGIYNRSSFATNRPRTSVYPARDNWTGRYLPGLFPYPAYHR